MVRASAPGKVLLAGEYAVLDGASAVVVAVDRRARARVGRAAAAPSPFLAAARDAIVRARGASSEEAAAAARLVVDSASLRAGDRKLGLGSSAAVTVAGVAAALATARRVEELTPGLRREIHALAHRAHAAAQAPRGARGSGADVAASTFGGVLRVRRSAPAPDGLPGVSPLPWPAALALVLVWTGQPADTPALVARVRALRDRAPGAHGRCLRALGDAGEGLAAALDRGDAAGALAAIRAGAAALAELGAQAGAPLVPPGLASFEALAAACGGAAKPTGAGGGDVLCALVPADAASDLRDRSRAAGLDVLAAAIDPVGVALAGADEPA